METQTEGLPARPTTVVEVIVAWMLPLFSVLIAGIALIRIAAKGIGDAENDKTTLMYFAAAALVLLLRDIKSLKMGDNEVVFKEAQEAKILAQESLKKSRESAKEITEVKELATTTTAVSLAAGRLGIGGRPSTTFSSPFIAPAPIAESDTPPEEAPLAEENQSNDDARYSAAMQKRATKKVLQRPPEKRAVAPPTVSEDDPQKGQWGGRSIANNRSLSATVSPLALGNDYFLIRIAVQSLDENDPLTGSVRFHLHPTFANSTPLVPVRNGKAELELVAWGAFTVGAEADGGATPLELDLADIGPLAFRNR